MNRYQGGTREMLRTLRRLLREQDSTLKASRLPHLAE
jgi:hypothetical protein